MYLTEEAKEQWLQVKETENISEPFKSSGH